MQYSKTAEEGEEGGGSSGQGGGGVSADDEGMEGRAEEEHLEQIVDHIERALFAGTVQVLRAVPLTIRKELRHQIARCTRRWHRLPHRPTAPQPQQQACRPPAAALGPRACPCGAVTQAWGTAKAPQPIPPLPGGDLNKSRNSIVHGPLALEEHHPHNACTHTATDARAPRRIRTHTSQAHTHTEGRNKQEQSKKTSPTMELRVLVQR